MQLLVYATPQQLELMRSPPNIAGIATRTQRKTEEGTSKARHQQSKAQARLAFPNLSFDALCCPRPRPLATRLHCVPCWLTSYTVCGCAWDTGSPETTCAPGPDGPKPKRTLAYYHGNQSRREEPLRTVIDSRKES